MTSSVFPEACADDQIVEVAEREHKMHSCDDPECRICNGGLDACEVCGCAEGTLLTFCPGEKVDSAAQDLIYDGILDYHPYVGWFRKRQNCS